MSTELLATAAEIAAPPADAPNPTRYAGVADPDRDRNQACARYEACLGRAAKLNWPSFHCRGCKAFVPKTGAERYREYIATLEMLADTQVLASLADHDGESDEDDDDELEREPVRHTKGAARRRAA